MNTAGRASIAKLAGILVLALTGAAFAVPPAEEKIYVAVEGESKLAVFDSATRQLLTEIDVSSQRHGMRMTVAPHNVQVAPDGNTVWVTVNGGHPGHGGQSSVSGHEAVEHGEMVHDGMGHGAMEAPADEVVVIDPGADTVLQRIPIAPGAHLAHVAVTPDSGAAYVTAQNENAIYKINARTFRIEDKIQAPAGSQPHGLRIAPDGSRAYVALLQGKGLDVLDLRTGRLETIPLNGAAVQTAVTPDGRWVLASLYDTKQLAVYDTHSRAVRYIELLDSARGPVQLYPSPDSRYVYVADQGHYFDQPDSDRVFKVDLQQSRVVWSVKAGTAPHGIVVAHDGGRAYVTNLVSNDLSVIDLKTDREAARIPVGKEPNGVCIWNRHRGGTP
jgi:YVTN family beta-propeller protein